MRRGAIERHFYERLVRNYDGFMEPLERRVFAAGRARLLARARGRTLDVGAGTGANFAHYGPDVERVVALDLEPRMLRSASEKSGGAAPAELLVGSAEFLPFAPASFDTVVASLVLCTVARPERAVAEIARVLKPAGLLLLLEHARASLGVVALLQDALTPLQRVLAGGCRLNRPTAALVDSAGAFEVVESRERFRGVVIEIAARRADFKETPCARLS